MAKTSQSPLPKRLKEARKAAKLSQEKLGIEAGLDESVVSARMSQYEHGVHTPDFTFIKKVALILNIPTAYFYCEEEDLANTIKAYSQITHVK